jgi:hypothetical protein
VVVFEPPLLYRSSDMRRGRIKQEAIEQLAGYVDYRTSQTAHRYVGVLTDGTEWDCYNLVEGRLQEVSTISCGTTADDLSRLIVWLEGVLATARGIAPTAQNIETRLGATSSAYTLDRASLSTLYERNKMTVYRAHAPRKFSGNYRPCGTRRGLSTALNSATI